MTAILYVHILAARAGDVNRKNKKSVKTPLSQNKAILQASYSHMAAERKKRKFMHTIVLYAVPSIRHRFEEYFFISVLLPKKFTHAVKKIRW